MNRGHYLRGMKRLRRGDEAPLFVGMEYRGKQIKLENYRGKKVLLAFHAFGSCPFCNLRVRELTERYNQWNHEEIEMIHVFPSSKEIIAKFAGKNDPRFLIISDPSKSLYPAYGAGKSIIGFLSGFMRLKKLFKALKVVNLFKTLTQSDAALHQMPSDFIIDEKGIVLGAFYANSTGDNVEIEAIENLLKTKKEMQKVASDYELIAV